MTSETKSVKFTNSQASVLLDLVRALAAFLVLISHWKIMFFVDYPQIPVHRIWFAAPYVFASAGHQSVLIFFILSGYLISGSIFRSLEGGFWQWRSYLTHRFVRLYVVLVPGLLLGAFFDWIGLHHTHFPDLFNGISAKSHHIDIASTFSLPSFLGNLAFLQTILVPTFGSNGALWSLANEFWYYLLFPLGLLAWRRATPGSLRVLYAGMFLAIAWLVRKDILPLFPVWLAGTLLTRLPRLSLGTAARILATLVYLPLIFYFSKTSMEPAVKGDYIFGLITFLFMWVLLSASGSAGNSRGVHLIRQGARFSFTLYVTHMPALLFLTALVAGDQLWPPNSLYHEAVALSVLAILLAFAYGIAALTEFHTDSVRRSIEKLLNKRSPLTPANEPQN